ncbi:MAG TPA: HEAT repeat domain-containing protein [Verrucomicrobiae bacterium]|jgi:HEAT repeat protein|nr:HEAT repeat domain-containing protein [Verrucomicrobiae bacterium]
MPDSRQNNSSGDPLRVGMLWPVALLLVVVGIGLFFSHSRGRPATQQLVEASGTNLVSTTAPAARKTTSAHPSSGVPPSGTEPETERLISVMSDKSLALALRRQAARSLARIGSDEAMAALKAALAANNPPLLKAAIAEGLGESPNPAARDLLHELLGGKDETTARAAARGLALRGDADAVDTLGNALFNDQTLFNVRTEAARALGDVALPSALDLLTRAISQIQDEDIQESVLDGLGERPFSETEPFFRNYLDSPNVSADSKVLAIEAITGADDDVGPFLLNYQNDPNPDVRAAVKSALDFLNPNLPAGFTNVSKNARK